MKLRLLIPMLAVVAFLAGCGSGSGISTATLEKTDIAVVGQNHITKADYDGAIAQEKQSLKAQGRPFPKAGSTDYSTMRNQIVGVLVQNAEYETEAAKLGVTVTPAEVDKQLTQIKTQYFGGSDAKYNAELKKQGFTDAQVRDQVRAGLLQQKVFNEVTKKVAVSDKDVTAYFNGHLDQYGTPDTRAVQEILVGKDKEALAKQIHDQIAGGGDFAALAKQYSQDPGSKDSGGNFTAKKGADVPEFDAAVFSPSLKTGQLAAPVNTAQYGWFVIKAVGDIVPAQKVKETKTVDDTIRQQLLSQAKNTEMSSWAQKVAKDFCTGGIKYQTGYTPVPDPCAVVTATNTTATG